MAKSTIDTGPLLKAARVFSIETRKKILAAAGKRMGVAAESFIPDYPSPSGKPRPKIYLRSSEVDGHLFYSVFESQAQQGKVFSLIAQGKIPTQRSGALGRSIVSAITELTGSSVTVRTGTALKYGPLVIGDDDEQSSYHKDHWWQLHKVLADNREAIEAEGNQALLDGVKREVDTQ